MGHSYKRKIFWSHAQFFLVSSVFSSLRRKGRRRKRRRMRGRNAVEASNVANHEREQEGIHM